MFAITLALASALSYGVSDFVGGLVSRRVKALRVVMVSYPTSVVIIAIAAPFIGGRPTGASLLWGMASGLVMAFAIWWFYLALAEGPISIVSPVTAIIVAGFPVIVGLLMGERLSIASYIGVALAMLAVLLVSREGKSIEGPPARSFTPRVAWLTVGSGTFFALSFIFTHQIAVGTGLWPLLVARGAGSIVIVGFALATRQAAALPVRLILVAVGIGVLDVIANVTMLYAFQAGMLSLVSVVISLYPAVTVGLAVTLVKEKIIKTQAAGMALAIAAVTVISIAG